MNPLIFSPETTSQGNPSLPVQKYNYLTGSDAFLYDVITGRPVRFPNVNWRFPLWRHVQWKIEFFKPKVTIFPYDVTFDGSLIFSNWKWRFLPTTRHSLAGRVRIGQNGKSATTLKCIQNHADNLWNIIYNILQFLVVVNIPPIIRYMAKPGNEDTSFFLSSIWLYFLSPARASRARVRWDLIQSRLTETASRVELGGLNGW